MNQEKELEKKLFEVRQFIEKHNANNLLWAAKHCQKYFRDLRKGYDEASGNIPFCDCDLGFECVCEACKKQDYENCQCEKERDDEEIYYNEV